MEEGSILIWYDVCFPGENGKVEKYIHGKGQTVSTQMQSRI